LLLGELADVERLKRIFSAYFADDLQEIVEERAHACALKYRQKLRRLHLSHTDYYLDTIQRLAYTNAQEQFAASTTLTHTIIKNTTIDYTDREENERAMLSISVV
jgi:dipeptidase